MPTKSELAPGPSAGTYGGSLHHRIRSEIRQKILSGEWMPGHRIPFEYELTTQYGCSRMTVNKVLTQLARAGLIERRRKAGSFVTRPRSQSAVLQIHDIGDEVSALGLPYGFRLISRIERAIGSADVGKLDLPKTSSLLDVTCCHYAGRQPFCLEQRLINLRAVPEAAAEDFSITTPGAWLRSRVPWTTAEHTISATAADRERAAALEIEVHTSCLIIERKTWGSDQPITFVRLTYPADAHRLVARFEPSTERDLPP